MLSIVFSHWYYDWGDDLVKKKDGTPFKTQKGAFRNHPCTQWAAASIFNTAWLIQHGCALSDEYTHRDGKLHGCHKACLLYTSPSPRDKRQSRMPSSA